MDDVAIVTTNPVRTAIPPKPKAASKTRPPGTIRNFFYMFPLAVVVLIQAFFLGKAIGGFTTFPIFTIQTYMTLGMVVVLMVVAQTFLRSIVYSTLFGVSILVGIFFSWFGDFWNPVFQNFKEVLTIMESAWSKKNIPYPILVSGIVSLAFAISIIGNFLCSLLVKYFFEIVFGTEWSDGRRNAYASTIVLLLVSQLAFNSYLGSIANSAQVVWKAVDGFRPMEEFVVRIPSAGQFGADYVWNYDPFGITAYEMSTGRMIRKIGCSPTLLAPSWAKVSLPFVATEKEITFFDKDLMIESIHCPYPASFPGFAEMASQSTPVPLLVRPDLTPNLILVMFDLGFWGAVSPTTGKFQWVRSIDAMAKINQLFLEDFLSKGYVVAADNLLFFSCLNGRIAAIKADTGELVWEYNHSEAKYSGKGQRALISVENGKLLAALPSGSLVALNASKGTVEHESKNVEWHPITAPAFLGGDAAFITNEGNYFRMEIDGGRVKMKIPVAENRLPLMPLPTNLERGFVGYRESLLRIGTGTNAIEPALTILKHVFATTPVFEGPLMFIGTQDGWVVCLHAGSYDEKWRVYVGGELSEDALALCERGLLVRAKSGSVYLLKKTLD